VVGTL